MVSVEFLPLMAKLYTLLSIFAFGEGNGTPLQRPAVGRHAGRGRLSLRPAAHGAAQNLEMHGLRQQAVSEIIRETFSFWI